MFQKMFLLLIFDQNTIIIPNKIVLKRDLFMSEMLRVMWLSEAKNINLIKSSITQLEQKWIYYNFDVTPDFYVL